MARIINNAMPPSMISVELDSVFYFRNVPYRWLPLLKEKVKLRAD